MESITRIIKGEKFGLKITHISDTHGKHLNFTHSIPTDTDVIVHSGDFLEYNLPEEAKSFFAWFRSIPGRHKILIGGNHDYLLDPENNLYEEMDLTGIHFLTGQSIEIDGMTFYGDSQVLMKDYAYGSAFSYQDENEGETIWSKIPDNTQVLITHGPPFDILDKVEHYDKTKRLGCKALKKRIEDLTELKLHLFGHVHQARGNKLINGVQFSNAATGIFSYEI